MNHVEFKYSSVDSWMNALVVGGVAATCLLYVAV